MPIPQEQPRMGQQKFVSALVSTSNPTKLPIALLALVDNGSEADLIDEAVVRTHRLPTRPLHIKRKLFSMNNTICHLAPPVQSTRLLS